MNFFIAQLNPIVGDLDGNAKKKIQGESLWGGESQARNNTQSDSQSVSQSVSQ